MAKRRGQDTLQVYVHQVNEIRIGRDTGKPWFEVYVQTKSDANIRVLGYNTKHHPQLQIHAQDKSPLMFQASVTDGRKWRMIALRPVRGSEFLKFWKKRKIFDPTFPLKFWDLGGPR